MIRRWVLFLIIVALILLGKSYLEDHSKLQDLRVRNQGLSEKITSLEQEIESLTEKEDRLTNDPDYIEHRARKKLKMSREGEVIIHVD